ncbi:tRNA (guanosine(46)-N7)-methyltransferase TrmB [Aequoribacter sp.]|uniref:tRNA (guanosine(46)-N7)-methyltransferase TrmB n=1 Tax=Aequoribacter sp. TaxID=2847771 RepID=UPI003F6A0AD4
MSESSFSRRIKSYVIRAGRMTEAQREGLDVGWPRFGLLAETGTLDYDAVFEQRGPVVFEIGFGMGQSLLAQALAEPDHRYVGVEVHRPGVGKLLHDAMEAKATNIRVYCHDAVEVLEQCIPATSLDRVQVFFPDPWHKKKHHKRRLIQPEFLSLLARHMKPGAMLHLATDWENYAEHMLEVLTPHPDFKNTMPEAEPYAPRPESRPLTKFEKRGERLGHGVWDLLFERV